MHCSATFTTAPPFQLACLTHCQTQPGWASTIPDSQAQMRLGYIITRTRPPYSRRARHHHLCLRRMLQMTTSCSAAVVGFVCSTSSEGWSSTEQYVHSSIVPRQRTMDEAGRFLRNFARTTPTLPCALMTCTGIGGTVISRRRHVQSKFTGSAAAVSHCSSCSTSQSHSSPAEMTTPHACTCEGCLRRAAVHTS
jgi:hypothetical protein